MARVINFEGRKITVPDDATDDEVSSIISSTVSSKPITPTETTKPIQPKSGSTFFENLTGGIIEPAMQMGSAMVAKPISEVMGMTAAAKDYITGQQGDAVGFKNKIQEGLTYSPRTQGGQFVSQNILAPIGNVVESAAGGIASSVTDNPIAQSGVKETLLQGLGIAGAKYAPKASTSIRDANIAKVAELAAKQKSQTSINAIRKSGQDIGLIAPAEGSFKELVSNLGAVNPHLSLKNRMTITDRLGAEVGLPSGAITDANVSTRVKELTSRYKAVESALGNEVPVTTQFTTEITNILAPMQEMFSQDPVAFSALAKPIELLQQQLTSTGPIKPSIAMSKIRQLRNDARQLAKDTSGDPMKAEMASTNLKLANMYEDLIEGALNNNNKTGLLESFRDARKKLSQIHLIDSARMADDLIDPQKFASEVGKYAGKKKFVTGDFKTIADFANTFGNVTKPITESQLPSASRWELLAATGGLGLAGPTGGTSVLGTLPMAVRTLGPVLAKRGMLQGGTPSYTLPIKKQVSNVAIPSGMLGTALSPYIEEQQ